MNSNINNENENYKQDPIFMEKNKSKTYVTKQRQVLILYTGGTIGMKKGLNGLYPQKNFLFEYMLNHPNFCDKEATLKYNKIKHITEFNQTIHFMMTPETIFDRKILYQIYEYDEIIDSSNMNLEYWKKIGRSIRDNYSKYDSFIVLHGTDTMNYTACILAFMLENLNKPVVLTGSQIPLIDMRNDALKNLVDALTVAGTYHIPEVTIMFDSKLFRGNRTIKNDNMGLDAFTSPNLRPLVEIGINLKVNWDIVLPPGIEEFNYFEDMNNHICVVKFFPIIKDSTFESFFKHPIQAVIIETYGAGNIPKDRPKIIQIMKEANERGVIIVNVSQCRTNSGTNFESSIFLENVVVNARDMTVECCLAKLSYLLGKGYDQEKIKTLFQENLRGEISTFHPEIFTMHSNRFVEALLMMMNREKKTEESYIIASSLLPTVINELVEKNNLNLLKKLKKIIVQINFKEFTKKNPLHIAAVSGDVEMARFLIKCRVNINEIDEDKLTPLNIACSNGNKDTAIFLRDNGGILNQNKDMSEFFCSFAKEGDLDSIRLFYECGANLMVGDYDKRTLAHIASNENKVDIIKFIVEETNINIMIEDRWGNTPYNGSSEEIKNIIKSKFRVDKLSKKNNKKINKYKL